MADLIFEPHNGYGSLDPDGEPWPFGYISRGVGKPVFELSTVFKGDPDELRALALAMTAAPALLKALQRLSVLADEIWVKYSDHEAALMREAWTAADVAIAKALGAGQ